MQSDKNQIKAVVLDLDQTLTTDTGSWIQFTKLIGADPKVHADIYSKFKSGELNYQKAKGDLIALWKTTGKTNRIEIEKIFNKVELRHGAFEAVNFLKSKYTLTIISGAIDVFVEVMARKLGIASYYASTKFVFDEKGELTDFHYKLSRGEEKLEFFDDFCNKNNTSPNECAAIGDGESDMPIFEKVRLPILFLASETGEEQKQKIKTQISDWKEIYKLL
jgi:phosphoserine phosphatase